MRRHPPLECTSHLWSVLTFSAIMVLLMGLVLFMTWIAEPTSPFPGPEVNLPKFKSIFDAMPLEEPKPYIVLTITRNAQFFIDNRSVLAEDLVVDFRKLKTKTQELIVYVRADQATPFRWIIWVTMRLKELGVEWIGLIVNVNQKPNERIVGVRLSNWRPPTQTITY